MKQAEDASYWVYRFFGADDTPLYVGCTAGFLNRLAHHKATQPWWDQVQRCDLSVHRPRSHARRVEVAEIARLAPLYNVQHNPRPALARAALVAVRAERASRFLAEGVAA